MSNDLIYQIINALERLGCQPEQSGDSWIAFCPVHELDGKRHNKSLSMRRGNKLPVVFHCHAGCSFNELASSLGLEKIETKKEVEATYEYRNSEGKIEFIKLRYWPKEFSIRNPNVEPSDPSKYHYKLPVHLNEFPLYRLPEILLAKETEQSVFYCEGEKDVDRLVKHELVATTNFDGASKKKDKPKWKDDYDKQLCGLSSLILLPDNDDPGRAHMDYIAYRLRGKVKEIITVDLGQRYPELKAGGDVSDWLNSGHIVEELLEIVSRSEPDKKKPEPEKAQPLQPMEAVILRSAASIVPRRIEWLWEGWLAVGKLHLLAGAPGTAKTTIALTWVAVVSRGGQFPDGSYAKQGKVLIWSSEDDPRDTLIPRLIAAGADLNNIRIVEAVKHNNKGTRVFDPSKDFPLLRAAVEELGNVSFMVIDSVADAVAGDAGKNNQVRRALAPIKEFSEEMGIATLGITHFNKNVTGKAMSRIIDSVAFVGLPRVVMIAFKKCGNGSLIMRAKSNIGPDSGGYEFYTYIEPLMDYDGITANRVGWKGYIEGSADKHLLDAELNIDDPENEKQRAEKFLLDEFSDGMRRESSSVTDKAKSLGISVDSLKRARKDLGMVAKKISNKWYIYASTNDDVRDSEEPYF